jgi:hypothetical protein
VCAAVFGSVASGYCAAVTHALSSSNTFRLYVHRNGENFIGLCTELREVIEGSTTDEIIIKTKALIDSVPNRVKTRKPRIAIRVGPSLRKISRP